MFPSEQRATILSFDSLMTNAGGILAQPALALPFILWSRQLAAPADIETQPSR